VQGDYPLKASAARTRRVVALAFKFEREMARHRDWREVIDAVDLACSAYRTTIFRPESLSTGSQRESA